MIIPLDEVWKTEDVGNILSRKRYKFNKIFKKYFKKMN